MSKDLKNELERMADEEKRNDMNQNTNNDDEDTDRVETATVTDADALAIVFDEAELYGNMIDHVVTEIQEENSNQYFFAHSIKCAAHTLQLAVKDALNDIDDEDAEVINLSKEVSKQLRLHSIRNELKEAKIKIVLPKLDVETRWNSTYLMLRGIYSCKKAIQYFANKKVNVFEMLLQKWNVLVEFLHILHIPYLTTISMQKKDFTLSDTYGVIKLIEVSLNKYLANGTIEQRTTLAEKLKTNIQLRKQKLLDSSLMLCSIYLDPRFKCDLDVYPDKLALVTKYLEDLWERISNEKNYEEISSVNQSSIQITEEAASEALFTNDNIGHYYEYLDQQYDRNGINSISFSNNEIVNENPNFNAVKTVIAEAISKYVRSIHGSRMKSNESILQFWENNKYQYSLELSVIANIIFGIPPTQADIERNFSALNFIFSERRYNLNQNLLENILLINLNKSLFYEINKEDIEEKLIKGRKLVDEFDK